MILRWVSRQIERALEQVGQYEARRQRWSYIRSVLGITAEDEASARSEIDLYGIAVERLAVRIRALEDDFRSQRVVPFLFADGSQTEYRCSVCGHEDHEALCTVQIEVVDAVPFDCSCPWLPPDRPGPKVCALCGHPSHAEACYAPVGITVRPGENLTTTTSAMACLCRPAR